MSSGAGNIHWPSVARAAAGFLVVMTLGWAVARSTGWDWIGYVATVPAAACGYAWANGYEHRAGVTPHGNEQEMSERAATALLVLMAGGVIVALVQREWYLATIGLAALGPLTRATARRDAR